MKTRVVKKASTPSKGSEDGSKGLEEGCAAGQGPVEELTSVTKPSPAPKIRKVIVKKKVVSKSQAALVKGAHALLSEIMEPTSGGKSYIAAGESSEGMPSFCVQQMEAEGVKEGISPPVGVGSASTGEVVATSTGELPAIKEEKPHYGTTGPVAVNADNQAPASSAPGRKVKKIVVIKKVVKRPVGSKGAAAAAAAAAATSPLVDASENQHPTQAEEKDLRSSKKIESIVPQDSVVGDVGEVTEAALPTEEVAMLDPDDAFVKPEKILSAIAQEKGLENSDYEQQQVMGEKEAIGEAGAEHVEESAHTVVKEELYDEEEYEGYDDEIEDEYIPEDVEEGEEEAEGDAQRDHENFSLEYTEAQEAMPVSSKQKHKKFEVFVGGLDRDTTEEDLEKVFETIGGVTEVRLVKNPQTGKNKGYAFVRFSSVAEAKRAATELEHVEVRGRECGVLPNEDNDIMFLGNINKTWNKDMVEETLQTYGVENIEELTLMEDPKSEGANRGFAFLEFSTHKDAVNAFTRLKQPNVLFGTDRFARVAWAEPFNNPDEEVMVQVKSVFVEGLPSNWDEERVKSVFGEYGEITRAVLSRNMSFARRSDFAFVNYVTRDDALACIEAMGSREFEDGKVKLKVTLAKPPPKSRAFRGAIRGGVFTGRPGGRFGARGFYRGGRFQEEWGRGAGRFGYSRAGLQGGRGYSQLFSRSKYVGSYSNTHKPEDDKSQVKELLRVLRDQTTQDVGPSSEKEPGQQTQVVQEHGAVRNGNSEAFKHVSTSVENRVAKYECHTCGFGSDKEEDHLKHTGSRVHKLIKEHRRDDSYTNKTPVSLLHEYAARHRCEVHYDLKANNTLGPFEVLATIGGGGTGIPLTKGVGKALSKAKGRQMAAADALEKILERVPDLQFSRSFPPKQGIGERNFAAKTWGCGFRGGKGRGFSQSGNFDGRQDGRRFGSGGHNHDESMFDDAVPSRGRSKGGYYPHGSDSYEYVPDYEAAYEGNLELIPRGLKRLPGRGRGRGRTQLRDKYVQGGDYSERFSSEKERSDGHTALAAHREAYFQHLGHGREYDSHAAIREYGEAMPGGKRPYAGFEEDRFVDSNRGNIRARAEVIESLPVASGSSLYPGGALYGSSSSYIPGAVPRSAAYAFYDNGVDASGFYPGAGEYSGGLELTGASSYLPSGYDIYTQASSVAGGFSVPGAGSGSFY